MENTPDRLRRMLWQDKVALTESGCWEWQGSKYNTGYGEVWRNGKKDLAHRVSYELKNGPLSEGEIVMHRCDNPVCVNPEHLFKGSQRDNVLDMYGKGRRNFDGVARGSKNGNSKLTWEEVREIRRLRSTGKYKLRELGEMFGVHLTLISLIANNKIWREVQ